jgi:hypothetical protein
MTHYDPAVAPEPATWLELDEQLRIALAEQYHNSKDIKLPDVRVHATFHVIVENQLAEGIQATVTAVARLMGEGVSRHDAIHAIGSALVEHMQEASTSKDPKFGTVAQGRLDAKLARLKGEDWK